MKPIHINYRKWNINNLTHHQSHTQSSSRTHSPSPACSTAAPWSSSVSSWVFQLFSSCSPSTSKSRTTNYSSITRPTRCQRRTSRILSARQWHRRSSTWMGINHQIAHQRTKTRIRIKTPWNPSCWEESSEYTNVDWSMQQHSQCHG